MYYIEDIENGLIQIPAFQRDFIWKTSDKLELFDSIKKGYPIGSILFWKPEKELFGKGIKIGPYSISKQNKDSYYILDGFQRLSTLFGCLVNPDKTKLTIDQEEWKKNFKICYDLSTEEFFIPRANQTELTQIPVYHLIDTRASFEFQREISKANLEEEEIELYITRFSNLGTSLIDYVLPSIDINGGEIEEAVEIFSRVNSKGADISPDWMVSALAYSKDKGFRLGTIIDNLLEELKIYNFNKIKRDVILNCITNSFGKVFFDQSNRIEELIKRSDFIPVTLKAVESIKKAVKFLFEKLSVIDAKLLPYNNQLIFITDFFNTLAKPSERQLEQLKQWFWITTYSNYFTIYSLSKQRKAYDKFQEFLKGKTQDPIYNDRPKEPFLVADFPDKIHFGSVRAKALLLFLLNHSYQFKTIKPEDVEGLSLSYLFYDIKNQKGSYYPESVIPTLQRIKSIDMSFMLNNIDDNSERCFLTEEMKISFEKGQKEKVLSLRKNLIMNAEKSFFETMGLISS
ncbi:MAG: DUF262 domain-containing protein [Desulfobacteraceae bacterium]|nr:DUF262 domain-containing protein [Desulfobacteraceae bacterium]